MYFMARRSISFLLSFLSGGWVGMSFRSSEKAPLTFCCRQRSRLLVKIRRTIFGWPAGEGEEEERRMGEEERRRGGEEEEEEKGRGAEEEKRRGGEGEEE